MRGRGQCLIYVLDIPENKKLITKLCIRGIYKIGGGKRASVSVVCRNQKIYKKTLKYLHQLLTKEYTK